MHLGCQSSDGSCSNHQLSDRMQYVSDNGKWLAQYKLWISGKQSSFWRVEKKLRLINQSAPSVTALGVCTCQAISASSSTSSCLSCLQTTHNNDPATIMLQQLQSACTTNNATGLEAILQPIKAINASSASNFPLTSTAVNSLPGTENADNTKNDSSGKSPSGFFTVIAFFSSTILLLFSYSL